MYAIVAKYKHKKICGPRVRVGSSRVGKPKMTTQPLGPRVLLLPDMSELPPTSGES